VRAAWGRRVGVESDPAVLSGAAGYSVCDAFPQRSGSEGAVMI